MNRNGTGFHPFAGLVDSIRPASEKIGRVCAIFAVGMYERLDRIAENTGDRTRTWRRVEHLIYTGIGTKVLEVPVGQTWTLKLITTLAASSVNIRSGGRLMLCVNFGTPGAFGPDAVITAGPGASIEISTNQAGEYTLHIEVTQRHNPAPGVSGEQHPAGIRTNAMALAIEQHFPGVLDVDGDPYDTGARQAPGTYGAGTHPPVQETRGDVGN